jgi:hypothetical protein
MHQGLLDERDAKAKSLILEYEKIKKKVGRAIAENPGDVFLIDHPKVGRFKTYRCLPCHRI